MGQIKELTLEQNIFFEEVGNDSFFSSNYYFGGGTALSSFYLHHRISNDLDFFSAKIIDSLTILNKVTAIAQKYNLKISPQTIENTHIFHLLFPSNADLKIDFSYYPYKKLKEGFKINNLEVASLEDIAASKLMVINQRNEVKDFVDFYFLLQKFTIWDLLEMVKIKYNIELDVLNTASDFLKAESFEFLPEMILPLSLPELKAFYQNLAKKLGLTATIK